MQRTLYALLLTSLLSGPVFAGDLPPPQPQPELQPQPQSQPQGQAEPVALQAEPVAHEGIAMNGSPKYADGFDHFDYANADAPKGGEQRLNISGSYDSFNPFTLISKPAAMIDRLVYQSLMARCWDEPFSLYGLVASGIAVPDDRSSATFTLRPEARWQDGEPLTADDVIFSFNTLREKGLVGQRIYYKKVATAEKLDDLHVKFTFKPSAKGNIDREMPLIIGMMPIFPEHIWKDKPFDRTTLELPVGSGPYKIATYDVGKSVTFIRDPNYWGRDLPEQRGFYNFDKLRIDYFRDENVSIEAFIAHIYDIRREDNPNKWVTAYDIPAVHDGRIDLKKFEHHRPDPADGFVFNTRRDPFKDPSLREALEYTFDSGWINKNLFHGQYRRAESFYPNSELAAPSLPDDKELILLDAHKAQLPPSIFVTPVTPPSTDGSEENLRQNLLKATDILRRAGYNWKGGRLYAPGKDAPVTFQITINDPGRKQIALSWAHTLERLGIQANVTNPLDSSAYQARLATFNYDVIINKWTSTLSPGNEQLLYWGSAAADQPGSRNYAGVHDPVVDALATAVTEATTREDLVTAVHALDRVLMAGHYTIPFYYIGSDNYVYWTEHMRYPKHFPLYGTILETWWSE